MIVADSQKQAARERVLEDLRAGGLSSLSMRCASDESELIDSSSFARLSVIAKDDVGASLI